MKYLVDMRMLWPNIYAPYYVASVGCHLLNLRNRRQLSGKGWNFHVEGGMIPDMRLHLLMTCPSGFGKSYTPRRFISNNETGLLDKSSIHAVFKGYMTEAGLVGTFKEGVMVRGLAHTHRDSILCLNELSAIQGEGEGYAKLGDALLDLLDDGHVHKNLAGGEIDYTSYVTLWAGTQHARFRLSSGHGRRLMLLEFLPDKDQRRQLRLAKRAARGVTVNHAKLQHIWQAWAELKNGLDVKTVDISEDLYDFFDTVPNCNHNDEELYTRLAMGYALVRYYRPGDKTLVVDVDETIQTLVLQAHRWRESLLGDSAGAQVLALLREQPGGMTTTDIKRAAQTFGLTYGDTTDLLTTLIQQGVVVGRRMKTRGRPTTLYQVVDMMDGGGAE